MMRSALGRHFDADLELPQRLDADFEAYLAVDREEREAAEGKDGDAGKNQGRHEAHS